MVIEEKNQHLSTESSLKAQQPEGQGRFPPDSCPAGREEQRGCALQGERRNEATELHELGKLQTRGLERHARGRGGGENRVRPGPRKSRLQDGANHARVSSRETS